MSCKITKKILDKGVWTLKKVQGDGKAILNQVSFLFSFQVLGKDSCCTFHFCGTRPLFIVSGIAGCGHMGFLGSLLGGKPQEFSTYHRAIALLKGC